MTGVIVRLTIVLWVMMVSGVGAGVLMRRGGHLDKLSFVSNLGKNFAPFEMDYEIYLYNLESGDLLNVTDNEFDDYDPAWSGDGYVAYASRRPGDLELYVLNLETGEERQLTDNGIHDLNPCWLSGGRLIYATSKYQFDRYQDGEIFMLDTGTGVATNVTNNRADENNPDCAADGWVAFTTSRDGDYEIYALDPATGESENLTRRPASNEYDAAWSADGRVAFTSFREGVYHLDVLNRETGVIETADMRSARSYHPTWSGCCLGFSFQANKESNSDIYVMDWATRVRVKVMPGGEAEYHLPVWVPES